MQFPPALDPIRSLQASWRILTQAPGPILVGGILLLLFHPSAGLHLGAGEDLEEILQSTFGLLLVGGCCGLLGLLVSSWLGIGFANVVDEVRNTGSSGFPTLFDARQRYGDMLLAGLLVLVVEFVLSLPFAAAWLFGAALHEFADAPEELAVLVGLLGSLLYLPFFLYVMLGLVWAGPAVALENRPAIDALRRSWQLSSGRRLATLVLFLVNLLFTLLGLCCCGVGILLTGSLAVTSWVEAFLELTRDENRPITPPAAPPPPPVPPPVPPVPEPPPLSA